MAQFGIGRFVRVSLGPFDPDQRQPKKALRLLQIYSARHSLNFESPRFAYPCVPAWEVGAAAGSGFEGATPLNQAFSGVRDRDVWLLLQQSI